MSKKFEEAEIASFLDDAEITDLTYHRDRKTLWGKFTKAMNDSGRVEVPNELFRSIKGALCCRNNGFTDDKALAFETAIEQIRAIMEDLSTPDQAE